MTSLQEVNQPLIDAAPQVQEATPGPQLPPLPILEKKKEFLQAVQNSEVVALIGPTGSGKTLMMFPMLRDIMEPTDRAILTQPSKKALRDAATQVNKILGKNEAEYIYRGAGRRKREDARMTFTTDGTLLQMLKSDPSLKDYSYVIIDEVHERNNNIDTALVVLLEHTQALRKAAGLPSLKVIITSATLQLESLGSHYPNLKVVEGEGRMFPVTPHYIPEDAHTIPPEHMPRAASETAITLLHKQVEPGAKEDILIFMPGEREVKDTIKHLAQLLGASPDAASFDLLPFYADLPDKEKKRVMEKTGKRKVIVATNIAETGLTIDTLGFVIDSGLMKQNVFNPATGQEMLILQPCSVNSIKQRMGRAGRVKEGEYYALFKQSELEKRPKQSIPAIMRSNLIGVVLMLKGMGLNPQTFGYIDRPPQSHIDHAVTTLSRWGAVDAKGGITPLGEFLAELPVAPEHAMFLASGMHHGCLEEMSAIVSMLEEKRSVFSRGEEKAAGRHLQDPTSDYVTMLNAWKEYQAHKDDPNWTAPAYLDDRTLKNADRTYKELLSVLEEIKIPLSKAVNKDAVGKAVAGAYIDQLMSFERLSGSYRMASGAFNNLKIEDGSSMARSVSPLMIGRLRMTEAKQLLVSLGQEVKLEWLKDIAPHLIQETLDPPIYDPKLDQVVQTKRLQYLKDPSITKDGEKQIVRGNEGTAIFIKALSTGLARSSVFADNQRIIEQINTAWKTLQGLDAPLFFSQKKLEEFYESRLKQTSIASIKELESAVFAKSLNLIINPSVYLPKEMPKQKTTLSLQKEESIGSYIEKKPPAPLSLRSRLVSFLRKLFGRSAPPQLPETI